MFSLFSSRTAKLLAISAGVTMTAVPTLASQAANDSVTTREAAVTIDGVSYQHVQFENRDYFIKAPRPGSLLSEVSCRAPKGDRAPSQLAVASRSREFVTRLQDGCAPRAAVSGAPAAQASESPERFTFEQPRAPQPTRNDQPAKPKQKVELLGPNSFPSDVDPHVLPEQQPAGGNFDWNQRRY